MNSRRHRDRPTEHDLAALADGSLAGARRADVERAVAESPELQAELRDQRYAVQAVRATVVERAPDALRARVAAQTAGPARSRPRARAVRTLALAGAAAVAVAAVITLTGSPAEAPSVADAAVLGTRPPAAGIPAAPPGAATLSQPVAADLRFPHWRRFGWKATGSREDRLHRRRATTVYYRRQSHVIAYTIVDGASLAVGAPARTTKRDGIAFRTLTVHGRQTVTWLRHGHTCVLSGTSTNHAALLRLAAWRGRGEIAF